MAARTVERYRSERPTGVQHVDSAPRRKRTGPLRDLHLRLFAKPTFFMLLYVESELSWHFERGVIHVSRTRSKGVCAPVLDSWTEVSLLDHIKLCFGFFVLLMSCGDDAAVWTLDLNPTPLQRLPCSLAPAPTICGPAIHGV